MLGEPTHILCLIIFSHFIISWNHIHSPTSLVVSLFEFVLFLCILIFLEPNTSKFTLFFIYFHLPIFNFFIFIFLFLTYSFSSYQTKQLVILTQTNQNKTLMFQNNNLFKTRISFNFSQHILFHNIIFNSFI